MGNSSIRTIAKLSGVSPSTVSFVLNDRPGVRIGELTRRRVLTAATTLGYQQSLLARAIKRPLCHIGVAIGIPDVREHSYSNELFAGVVACAADKGYVVALQPLPTEAPLGAPTGSSPKLIRRMQELHQSKLIDGFVIDKASFTNTSVVQLHELGVPLVTVNGAEVPLGAGGHVPFVTVDHQAAGHMATEHLIQLQHRRIGLVTTPYRQIRDDYRPYGVGQIIGSYRDTLAAAGLEYDADLIADGHPLNLEFTGEAVRSLMAQRVRPTAIIFTDDAMAVMGMNVLRSLGFRIPDDVSVVGFGDWANVIPLSDPLLTTVRAPVRESGHRACELLIGRLEEMPSQSPDSILPCEFIVRQSTAATSSPSC